MFNYAGCFPSVTDRINGRFSVMRLFAYMFIHLIINQSCNQSEIKRCSYGKVNIFIIRLSTLIQSQSQIVSCFQMDIPNNGKNLHVPFPCSWMIWDLRAVEFCFKAGICHQYLFDLLGYIQVCAQSLPLLTPLHNYGFLLNLLVYCMMFCITFTGSICRL